jgi:hypothetical protein
MSECKRMSRNSSAVLLAAQTATNRERSFINVVTVTVGGAAVMAMKGEDTLAVKRAS